MATQSAILSKQLGTTFARAAPQEIKWAREREFFNMQVLEISKNNDSVQQHIAHNNERTLESLRSAAVQCASMGLSMNPIAALVYFIPRRERKRDAVAYPEDKSEADYKARVPWIITATPSYRGLAYIATHYAGADDVAAEIVYKAEVDEKRIELRGPLMLPLHRQTMELEQRTYALAVGVYCAIRWPGARARCEYVDRHQVLRIRERSDRPGSLMWNENALWTEGWKKAATRRACKLGIQGNPRMDAAETVMRETEGIIIDGEAAEVPRGTPANGADPAEGDAPEASKRAAAKGMAGLRTKLDTAQTAQRAAQEDVEAERAAIKPQETRKPDPPVDQRAGGDLFGAPTASSASRHPEGSIEWWGDLILACRSWTELDTLKAQALAKHVDRGEDADTFRNLWSTRRRALRITAQKQEG